jgi:hypothetical protein
MRRVFGSLLFVLSLGCGPDDTLQPTWSPGQYSSPTSVEYHGRLTWTFVPDGQSPVAGVEDLAVQLLTYSTGSKLLRFPDGTSGNDDFWVATTWHVTQTGESVVLGYPLPHNDRFDDECLTTLKASGGSGTISSTRAELHLSGAAAWSCGVQGIFDATFTGDAQTP